MAFDYKKEYKEFYLPAKQPHIIAVPPMNYLAVRGHGDPNIGGGDYKRSIELLYAIAFTLKMSKKTDYRIEGYFDYVVPPLEGLWWQDDLPRNSDSNLNCQPCSPKSVQGNQSRNSDVNRQPCDSASKQDNQLCSSGSSQNDQQTLIDYTRKDQFNFISLIRLPDFITRDNFNWAIQAATEKRAKTAKKNDGKEQDFSKVEFLSYDEGLCVQCLHVGSYDSEPTTIKAMSRYATEQGYELDIQNPRYHHEIYLSDPRRCQVDRLKTVIRHPIKPLT